LLFGLGFANVPVVVGTVLVGSDRAAGAFRGCAFASLIGLTGAATFWLISLRERDLNRDTV
jgi:hypothetical protein